MGYLDQYRDPGIEPKEVFESEGIREHHINRLAREAAIGWVAYGIPRRLGRDATPRELGRDKQFAKRYAYGAEDMLKAWEAPPKVVRELLKTHMNSPKTHQIAAQADWKEHILQLCAYLRGEIRFIATTAIYHGEQKEGNKLVLRLENELYSQAQRYEKVFGNPINPAEIPEI